MSGNSDGSLPASVQPMASGHNEKAGDRRVSPLQEKRLLLLWLSLCFLATEFFA
jgi:hypothetical protein